MPVFAGGELNGWMIVGFVLATGAVIGNDSLQTLGTYISSNHQTTPKGWQMLFLCVLTAVVLLLGWFLNNGDPAWGRLVVSGRSFPLPDPFTWVYVLPPVVALLLTRWGAPLSTSFLVLSSFEPARVGALLASSLVGYGIAFGLGLVVYGLGLWLLERRVCLRPELGDEEIRIWGALQWCSTACLWSSWLVQDLANIFVFVPRRLDGQTMAICTLVICLGLCLLVARGGGPVHTVLQSKSNTADLRSATLIDAVLALCLVGRGVVSSFPVSTTWVFLGLLAGREVALRIRLHSFKGLGSDPSSGGLVSLIGRDLGKAGVALAVSLVVARGMHPLVVLTTG